MSDDTYHRMCDDPLIQGQWTDPKVGDWTHVGLVNTVTDISPQLLIKPKYRSRLRYAKHELIWHPTQEDLQGMLSQNDTRPPWRQLKLFVKNLYHWIYDDMTEVQDKYLIQFSIRELCIMLYMHGHGLRWDDSEGWVKENTQCSR